MSSLVSRTLLALALLPVGITYGQTPEMPRTVAAGAKLVEQYSDGRFFEGPTWDPQAGKLYFTAFGKTPIEGRDTQQILRLDEPGQVTVWADNTEGINGTYLSLRGRLLGAQAYGHRITDYGFGPNGPADPKTLVHDPTLHQPNDVCQAPNGTIYFTDPDFKNRQTSAVYMLAPGSAHKKIITDMPLPNGLITSLNGKTLYVGDSAAKHWRAYPIQEDGTVGQGRLFFEPETENQDSPDGMSIDAEGNLYFSGRGGVWVVTPAGESLGLIAVPEFCSNVTFGGSDGKTLFLTCSKKLYSLPMNVAGGQFSPKP